MTTIITKLKLRRLPVGDFWESKYFNKVNIILNYDTIDFILYYGEINVCFTMSEKEIELFDIETIEKIVKKQLASLVGDHFFNKVLQIVS